MADLARNLRRLSHDALGASKKRKQVSDCLKKAGFESLGKGAWLGFRNCDVVSGLIVEGSSLDTYISTFVLPAFDSHGFVSWSLGGRIVHCDLQQDTQLECQQAMERYVSEIVDIKSPNRLIKYLEANEVSGHYPIWVRYICLLRLSQIDAAIMYLDASKRSRLHQAQLRKFEEIERYVAAHDNAGVLQILENWSTSSERIFGPLDQTFEAV